jgi:hypothetical protein
MVNNSLLVRFPEEVESEKPSVSNSFGISAVCLYSFPG